MTKFRLYKIYVRGKGKNRCQKTPRNSTLQVIKPYKTRGLVSWYFMGQIRVKNMEGDYENKNKRGKSMKRYAPMNYDWVDEAS